MEHRERFRVQWIDTDAGGRIHFTAAFRWAEATETMLYKLAGLPNEELQRFPRRRVEAEYRRVLVYDDEIELRLRVEKIGTTSLTFGWEAIHDGEVAIEGRHTVVHVDESGRPSPLDERLKAALSRAGTESP
jgi:YbgC/YbaW family acyl-CoA thioester hydrolase